MTKIYDGSFDALDKVLKHYLCVARESMPWESADILNEVLGSFRPFSGIASFKFLDSVVIFFLFGQGKLLLILLFFPRHKLDCHVERDSSDSCIEFFEATSDAFDDLTIFVSIVFGGFL